MKRRLYTVLAIILTISCQVQELVEEQDSILTFYATGESGTRTTLSEPDRYWGLSAGRTVLWSPSDEINIYCQNGGGKFVSTNTETTGETVAFVGTLEGVRDRKSNDLYWAVYPYSEDNTFDGHSFGVSLKSEQQAVLGNVEKGLMISLARSGNNNLYFRNLCGIITIPVYERDIKKIIFKGNNGEPLAGKVKVSFDESGCPVVTEWKEMVSEITLLPSDGGTFEADKMYNVVCIPGYFEKGYTIEFYRDELVSIKQIHTPVSLSRAKFVNMTDLYTGGTIYSVDYGGKTYSLNYAFEEDSSRFWVNIDEKVIEIPQRFKTWPTENPTRMGPAVAINTDTETIYFAMANAEPSNYGYNGSTIDFYNYTGGTVYRITSSGFEKNELDVLSYPSFRLDEATHNLELHSYHDFRLNDFSPDNIWYAHSFQRKTSYNHWTSVYTGDDDIDESSLGYSTKSLSDVILLYQEEIKDYPMEMTTVDLGLSVKWGSCNLGARDPMQYGDRYAWGEIAPKDSFTSENYIFGGAHSNPYSYWDYLGCTKYNDKDEKYFLDSEDDAAHVKLGEDWRTPSPEEWQELIDNCDWKWTSLNDAVGVVGTSKINGNCIFFPVAPTSGDGSLDGVYHSSQVGSGENYEFIINGYYNDYGQSIDVAFSYIVEAGIKSFLELIISTRYEGAAIRPVYGHIAVEDVQLEKERIEIINLGESVNLCVTVLPGNATNKNVIWESSDETVATVSQSGLVTGISDGRAIITATTQEGGLEASCEVVVGVVPISDFYFENPESGLFVGDARVFHPVIVPEDATYREVSWSSSNPSVASVSGTGEVRGVSEGSAVITATEIYGGHSATCLVYVLREPSLDNTPEYVDMGVSVKWASRNIGATSPESYGDYFAWGETEPKDVYTWETYKWCAGTEHTLTKYCGISSYGYNGFVDNKTQLDDDDDAAKVRLGGKWRMPTIEEMVDLVDHCIVVPSAVNGVGGCYFVSKSTRNAIFIPASGMISGNRASAGISNIGVASYYLSKSTTRMYVPYCLFVSSSEVSKYIATSRQDGHTIRPVYADDSGNEGITPGGDINM